MNLLSETDGLRTYQPEVVKGRNCFVVMQLCEEFDPESGRWEAFYSTPAAAPTKAEAEFALIMLSPS